jgi:hypothetical protein
VNPKLTPTQRLAEEVLGEDLGQYVRAKRQARPRWTWALISEQLATDTSNKVSVTPQALWGWYAADESAAS